MSAEREIKTHAQWVDAMEYAFGIAPLCGLDVNGFGGRLYRQFTQSRPVSALGRTAGFWAWKLAGGT